MIIEVIRTHYPEIETFERLQKLSLANTLVVFYFIDKRASGSKINNQKLEGVHLTLRVSRYMIGGELYINGKAVVRKKSEESFEYWYGYLTSTFFAQGMQQAK